MAELVIWIVVGVMVLSSKKVTKLDFMFVWVALILKIVGKMYGH